MLNKLPSDFDIREGGTFWDIYAPVAIEVSDIYNSIREGIELSFTSTSYGRFLELRAIEAGLEKKKTTKAKTSLKFVVSDAVTIPKDTRVSAIADSGQQNIVFLTDEVLEFIAAGTDDVEVTALTAGKSSNVNVNSITNLLDDVSNIISVTNPAASIGGRDEEADPELIARILRRVRNPSRGGNIGDYLFWSEKSNSLVEFNNVYPTWRGGGTVKVVVLGSNSNHLPLVEIQKIQDFIYPEDEVHRLAPVGALVTVENAHLINIDVKLNLILLDNYNRNLVYTECENNIEKYFNNLKIGESVRYFGIGESISTTAGVFSVVSLTLQKYNSYIKETNAKSFANANADGSGIARTLDRIFILNETNDKIFVYDNEFAHQSSEDFTATVSGIDIGIYNDILYILEITSNQGTLRAHNLDGTRRSSDDITLDDAISDPVGFDMNGKYIYIVNNTSDKIYVCNYDGNRIISEEKDLQDNNDNASSIALSSNRMYVYDTTDNIIYVYGYDNKDFSSENIDVSDAGLAISYYDEQIIVCKVDEALIYNQDFEASDLMLIQDEKAIFGNLIRTA